MSIWEPTDQVVAFPWLYQAMRVAFTFKLYTSRILVLKRSNPFEWPYNVLQCRAYTLAREYLLRPLGYN